MSKKPTLRSLAFFLFSMVSTIVAHDAGLGQVQFDEPINLSHSRGVGWSAELVAVDSQVMVYWLDYTDSAVRLAHSSDVGRTFRTWNLSPKIESPFLPTAVADGDNIYVSWYGLRNLSDLHSTGIFLARSNDRGETFQVPFDITRHRGGGYPTMRVQEGVLNAAWNGTDRDAGLLGLFFMRSTDFGQSFTEPIRVTSFPGPWAVSSSLGLALNGDRVYLLWKGAMQEASLPNIYFTGSRDAGTSFDQPINLSRLTQENVRVIIPELAIGTRDCIYAAWTQGEDRDFPPSPKDVYFVRSTDGGQTFSTPFNLSKNPQATNVLQQLVAAGDNVYIVWSGAAAKIFFSYSTDNGETFSAPKIIGGYDPQIAVVAKGLVSKEGVSEDTIYLAWSGDLHSTIYYSVSFDGGATFSNPQNVSNREMSANLPRITAVGSDVYLVWRQDFDAIFVRGQLNLDKK